MVAKALAEPESPHLPSLKPLRYNPRMSVQELEIAVSRLSSEELARFTRWFEVYVADQWDRQIEADILSGRFDAAGRNALEDFKAGRCKPL